MHFIYLIAAYNETSILPNLIERFDQFSQRGISFEVYIVDNGSTDGSQEMLREYSLQKPWLHPFFIKEKGLGFAFNHGLSELRKRKDLQHAWIFFNAADLPFNFSDLDSFLKIHQDHEMCHLFIGSKYHPQSKIQRNFKRVLGSYIFYFLRLLILQLNIKDTQGTIIMKADEIFQLKTITANDYFFTTELIYRMKFKTSIIELPVVYEESKRPSTVRLFRDGYRSMKQLIKLKFKKL